MPYDQQPRSRLQRIPCRPRALGLKLAARSTTGYDAQDEQGERYEIKGRRPTKENKSRQLSQIRGLEKKHFTYLAGVLFNEDFSVHRACLIPWEVVTQIAIYRTHTNAYILHLRDSLWDQDGVQDITLQLKQAEQDVPLIGALVSAAEAANPHP